MIGFGRLGFVVVCIVVFTAFLFGARAIPIPTIEIDWNINSTVHGYTPARETVNGKQVVLVFVGSHTCGFSSSEVLSGWIERAKLDVKQRAEEKGYSFLAIGVSVGWDPFEGAKYLGEFGQFDEIVTGNSWQGTGGQMFGWGKLGGMVGTPNILVFSREITSPSSEARGARYSIADELVLVRKVGYEGIRGWVEEGTWVPLDEPVALDSSVD